MKIAHKIGIAAAAGALTIGGAASAFAAGNSSSGTTGNGGGKAAAKAFICAHLPEVQAQQQLHEQLLSGRLTLLGEAKDAASAANHPKVVAKIDAKITTTNAKLAKVKEREAKVAEACATPAPAATAAG
ncbi:MAG: hypothetical protein ABIR68_17730 [Ilumatobacteraceae bacterium]